MRSLIILFLSAMFVSCSLFETREPELPNVGGEIFLPAISPEIVIDNLIRSISSKNVDGYMDCFSNNTFSFIPSANINNLYPNFFDAWQISNERRFFSSLILDLEQMNSINFQLDNKNFDLMTPDSVILISNYSIEFDYPILTYSSVYQGKLMISIVPSGSGIWAISRWQDFQNDQAETTETLSFLKAYFYK